MPEIRSFSVENCRRAGDDCRDTGRRARGRRVADSVEIANDASPVL
jgi:hypothetical protein